jgi:hypothetical protein
MTRLSLILMAASYAYAASAPNVTGISATFHDGQTFLSWTDPATGSAGANYRYEVYWSTSPIVDAPSLAAATFLQEAFNNSGQLAAAGATWNQTTRQNSALPMSITTQGSCGGSPYTACGTPLAAFTGLAVHTATTTASAYYAVITHDRTGAQTDSPVSAGNNATASPVAESVGTPLPIKVFDSHDTVNRNSSASSVTITGTTGLPFWLNVAGSGGCTDYKDATLANGDLYQFWGDSTMGYQEGVQQMFTVQETHNGTTYGVPALYMAYCDMLWQSSGLASLETIYSGYEWPNATTFQPYTENLLIDSVNWAISHYSANPNKIYQTGQSAGGYAGDWAIRHPQIFAAVFDSASEWQRLVADSMVSGILISPVDSTVLMAGTGQQFLTRFDMPAYISSHCGGPLPFIAFAVGRNDTSRSNQWTANVNMLNALKACHAGFAFAWNNGTHSDAPTALNSLKATYQTAIARNVSYPAFVNSSIDDDITAGCASGSPGPTCQINAGFSWTTPVESATSWSAAISNAGATLTVDITPRNTQTFHPAPGQLMSWTASTGQIGTVAADAWGLATAAGVTVNAGAATTLTFQPVTGGVAVSGLVSASGIAVIR